MQLVSNALAQECAMGAVMLGYLIYYYESWILPSLMRQEKMQYSWNAAWKKYHENIWKLNNAYDRELRYSAVSKNLLLEHINHTKPKDLSEHVSKMILANRKLYDAFNPSSKRVLIWQMQPPLQ
eukprot:jgi/Chrzof1/12534/Cz06g37200.t1